MIKYLIDKIAYICVTTCAAFKYVFNRLYTYFVPPTPTKSTPKESNATNIFKEIKYPTQHLSLEIKYPTQHLSLGIINLITKPKPLLLLKDIEYKSKKEKTTFIINWRGTTRTLKQ